MPSPTHLDLATFPVKETVAMMAPLLQRISVANDAIQLQSLSRFHARSVPAISIAAYLQRILKYAPASNAVFISVLVYLDRMASAKVPFVVCSANIHRLLISAVMVATKFFSDVFYTNSHYAKVGGLSITELNQLELEFLFMNEFNLMISQTEFQRYADQLLAHAIAEKSLARANSAALLNGAAVPSSTTSSAAAPATSATSTTPATGSPTSIPMPTPATTPNPHSSYPSPMSPVSADPPYSRNNSGSMSSTRSNSSSAGHAGSFPSPPHAHPAGPYQHHHHHHPPLAHHHHYPQQLPQQQQPQIPQQHMHYLQQRHQQYQQQQQQQQQHASFDQRSQLSSSLPSSFGAAHMPRSFSVPALSSSGSGTSSSSNNGNSASTGFPPRNAPQLSQFTQPPSSLSQEYQPTTAAGLHPHAPSVRPHVLSRDPSLVVIPSNDAPMTDVSFSVAAAAAAAAAAGPMPSFSGSGITTSPSSRTTSALHLLSNANMPSVHQHPPRGQSAMHAHPAVPRSSSPLSYSQTQSPPPQAYGVNTTFAPNVFGANAHQQHSPSWTTNNQQQSLHPPRTRMSFVPTQQQQLTTSPTLAAPAPAPGSNSFLAGPLRQSPSPAPSSSTSDQAEVDNNVHHFHPSEHYQQQQQQQHAPMVVTASPQTSIHSDEHSAGPAEGDDYVYQNPQLQRSDSAVLSDGVIKITFSTPSEPPMPTASSPQQQQQQQYHHADIAAAAAADVLIAPPFTAPSPAPAAPLRRSATSSPARTSPLAMHMQTRLALDNMDMAVVATQH
ncbi:cyclin-like protein interacting with PHO85 [Sorochytrium milnesiophthora]